MSTRSFLSAAVGIIVAAILVAVLVAYDKSQGEKNMPQTSSNSSAMQLASQVFRDGAPIPPQYSCKGANVSPPLTIMNVPAGAKSLALIMHDPDAPVGDYVHWTMWDIPASTESIAANSVPVGAVQGRNSADQNKYMGPCPPSGTHRYMFELYALDNSLNLSPQTSRDELKKAMQGHVVAEHTLTGVFSAQ